MKIWTWGKIAKAFAKAINRRYLDVFCEHVVGVDIDIVEQASLTEVECEGDFFICCHSFVPANPTRSYDNMQ